MQSRIVQLTKIVSELRNIALIRPVVAPADLRCLREAHASLGQVIRDLEAVSPVAATASQIHLS